MSNKINLETASQFPIESSKSFVYNRNEENTIVHPVDFKKWLNIENLFKTQNQSHEITIAQEVESEDPAAIVDAIVLKDDGSEINEIKEKNNENTAAFPKNKAGRPVKKNLDFAFLKYCLNSEPCTKQDFYRGFPELPQATVHRRVGILTNVKKLIDMSLDHGKGLYRVNHNGREFLEEYRSTCEGEPPSKKQRKE